LAAATQRRTALRRPLNAPQRTALLSVLAAAALVVLKLVTGLLTGSLGLIAEALHSGTDLVAALLTFLALGVSGRPADRDHPFGHAKAEHLAALGEAGFLVLVSIVIAVQAVIRLVSGDHGALDPSLAAIAVVVVVIGIDASRATISWRASRRHHSAALASNALHFGSDLVGSGAVLAGLIFARAGYPGADPIAALVVSALVVSAAIRLMRRNVDVLMDRAPAQAELIVRDAIARTEPSVVVDRVRVRQAGGRHFVEVTVEVSADAALGQGHAVADAVEAVVTEALPESDVVVHVEPRVEGGDLRERASGAALTVRGVREIHNVTLTRVDGRQELSLHLKLPGGETLAAAHRTADTVEAAIASAVPEIDVVHTHIEPLAVPHEARRPSRGDAVAAEEAIRRTVLARTGRPPRDLSLRRDPNGLVAHVTIALPADEAVAAAHDTAQGVERELLASLPQAAAVVVHTEPE
jgi:cation diffusion facilitator family transporter